MNWYKKAQESPAKMYHVTSPFSAEKIMKSGFNPNILSAGNSFHFTNKDGVKKWAKLLQKERLEQKCSIYSGIDRQYSKCFPDESESWKNVSVLEVTIPQSLYDSLHRLGDDIFYKGYEEKYSYKHSGYIKNNICPLVNGKNCTIRLLSQEEINELV